MSLELNFSLSDAWNGKVRDWTVFSGKRPGDVLKFLEKYEACGVL